MFEPRVFRELLERKDLTFIGGTLEFDLWAWVDEEDLPRILRVHRVDGSPNEWDLFDLPLLPNQPYGRNYKWGDDGLHGQWDDVQLTREQINEIETYLRCFASWVLGKRLTGENNNE